MVTLSTGWTCVRGEVAITEWVKGTDHPFEVIVVLSLGSTQRGEAVLIVSVIANPIIRASVWQADFGDI